MANIIEIGSLYLGGHPVEPGAEYVPGQPIEIGETIPGKEIRWVVVDGMLIADRCILTNVSWDDLNTNDLVFGKEVTIDRYRYQTRLLKVGAKKGTSNEWNTALNAVGEDNELWHWMDIFFWGQETLIGSNLSRRAHCGCFSARGWGWDNASDRDERLGFRPILIPLATKQLTQPLLGQQLLLWGGQSIVSGRLEQVTDYDAVLSNGDGVLSHGFGTRLYDGCIVVDRSAVVGMQNI